MTRNVTEKVGPRINGSSHIPSLLSQLTNRLASGSSDTYLRLFGIGINDFRILTAIIKWPGCIATFVADRVGIHKAIVSRSLRTMEGAGFLTGGPETRERKLYLTDEGVQLHDRIAQIAMQRERLLLKGLTRTEVAQLRELLRRMIDNLPEVNAYDPAERRAELVDDEPYPVRQLK